MEISLIKNFFSLVSTVSSSSHPFILMAIMKKLKKDRIAVLLGQEKRRSFKETLVM